MRGDAVSPHFQGCCGPQSINNGRFRPRPICAGAAAQLRPACVARPPDIQEVRLPLFSASLNEAYALPLYTFTLSYYHVPLMMQSGPHPLSRSSLAVQWLLYLSFHSWG